MLLDAPKQNVLVVDDLKIARYWIKTCISDSFNVYEASSQLSCMKMLASEDIHVVVLDLLMPGVIEFQLFDAIHGKYPDIPIIFLSSEGRSEMIVKAIKHGAKDYIFKGDIEKNPSILVEHLNRILSDKEKARSLSGLALGREEQRKHIKIPQSKAYMEAYERALKAVRGGLSVVFLGETGTGKDTMVAYVHEHLLPEKPLISINCGAICKSLSEAELFGFEKGAFTGADFAKKGKLELAHGGILFLDEVGNMPLDIQEKLLCVLENKCITRVGSEKQIIVDFKLISATNKNLEEEVLKCTFREDLYYRIKQFSVTLPSLRDQPEAIPIFVKHFVSQFNDHYKTDFKMTEDVMAYFQRHPWKGNVRELKNTIQTMIALYSQGDTDVMYTLSPLRTSDAFPLNENIETIEKNSIVMALKENRSNIAKAARQLGLHRSTLQGKMRKYQL